MREEGSRRALILILGVSEKKKPTVSRETTRGKKKKKRMGGVSLSIRQRGSNSLKGGKTGDMTRKFKVSVRDVL